MSDVPNLDQVPENAVPTLPSSALSNGRNCNGRKLFPLTAVNVFFSQVFGFAGSDGVRAQFKQQKFVVIGHRGSGMNMLNSTDSRLKAIKENSILSFNEAGKSKVDFVEFDVQVCDGVFLR